MITPANVDDRKPVPEMTKNLFGKLFGDRVVQNLISFRYEDALNIS
nr:transposase [Nostoc mirabile]